MVALISFGIDSVIIGRTGTAGSTGSNFGKLGILTSATSSAPGIITETLFGRLLN